MNDQLGNTEKVTVAKAVYLMETAISEGFQSSAESGNCKEINVFGRPVAFHYTSGISFLSGMASTGLRAGAWLDGSSLAANYNQLSEVARQHLATVIHSTGNHNCHHAIAEAGCFYLFASNPQEAADFTLIAHRIAELSLIPGICIHEGKEAETTLPSKEIIITYLGNPDDHIDCPTPAQQIIFGGKRRRVPNWFNLDYPSANGSPKNNRDLAFEIAAKHKYFYSHLPKLIGQAFNEYNSIRGTDYAPITTHQANDAQHLILTQGATYNKVKKVVISLRDSNQKVGCLNLAMLRPFPAEQITSLLLGKKSVTILENINGRQSDNAPLYAELLAALSQEDISAKLYSGQYGPDLSEAEITAVFDNMTKEGKQKFYLGIDFSHKSSKYPKHEVLLGNIRREYPNIQENTLEVEKAQDPQNKKEDELNLPQAIRRYQDHGPAYTRLSRFFDDTGYFYKTNNEDELVADPFQAVPITPSATASFADYTKVREAIPRFKPQNCTGCGDCFVNCPHSAIPPITIGLENLIKAGADIATRKGTPITKITPQIKNLANLSAKAISESEDISTAEEFLQTGFHELAKLAGLKDKKLNELRADFDAILEVVSGFPTAITEPFFNEPNAQEKGSGEIFSLAIDPSACTGCGVCARACTDEALEMTEQMPDLLKEMQSNFRLWEQLPDTTGDTIERMHHNENYNSFAAILLSRNYYLSMTGGSSSETGAPSKALMHLVTAATESAIQPKIIAQIQEIDNLITTLNKDIHKRLSETLPKENFDLLEKTIKDLKGKMTSIDDVIGKMGKKGLMKQLDTNIVQRKIDLTHALKDLKWVLFKGPTGIGRSRYGMALTGAEQWATEYPYNNLTSPATISWNGATPELAMGLFRGQLRYLLDNIKIMRRARLEAKNNYDPGNHDREIAGLTWSDLSNEEKALVPPILVVGDKSAMNEHSWSGLNQLLASKWPVKVVLINNAEIVPGDDPAKIVAKNSAIMLSAIALKNAFVLQGSMGNPSHLFNGILEGMESPEPSLFSIFAPEHKKHFIVNDAWPKLAGLALNSRAFPSLRFNPKEESKFLSSAIHLGANPDANENWYSETLTYSEGEEEHSFNYAITWADWAYTIREWKSHFSDYKKENGAALPVSDYIALDEDARNGNVPVIIRAKEGNLERYAISKQAVTACEVMLTAWNTWRELAGTLSEFPEKLKKKVTAELSLKFGADLEKAKDDFENRLKDQERTQVEAIRQKLKEKLVALAKQGEN